MEKKTYYVTVESGDILETKTDAAYQFEIQATPDEIEALEILFHQTSHEAFDTFLEAHVPFKPYHEATQNEEYDAKLYKVYETIYNLGSPETKQFIEKNNILQKINQGR